MFNLRSLDLNLLTVFEAVYELGTVSAAAERLSLSQSATSHALSRLREACEDELFVRVQQGLSPTPVASALYVGVNEALEGLRTSLASASGFDPARSRRQFRIGIPHPMGPFYALALRASVSAVAPGVVLTFDTASRPVNLEDNLRQGLVDIVVDWLPIELDPIVNKEIFEETLMLLARADHPLVNAGITLKDFLNAEFVAPNRRRELQYLPQTLRELYQLGMRETMRVSELLEIPIVVASTDLLGIFPSSMGALLRKRLGLQIIAIPVELPVLPIYMIWHEARRNDAGHRWLREVVEEEMTRFPRG
jgi:LysR family transcriptional activator for leuABCD operon